MNKLIDELYENRLLDTDEKIEGFEEALDKLAEEFEEEYIADVCRVFDDNAREQEMMFGLIHLIEAFSSERAFELTALGVAGMTDTAIEWAKIIMYRILNHSPSRKMLKKAISVSEDKTRQAITNLLNTIKAEESDRFSVAVDEVLY